MIFYFRISETCRCFSSLSTSDKWWTFGSSFSTTVGTMFGFMGHPWRTNGWNDIWEFSGIIMYCLLVSASVSASLLSTQNCSVWLILVLHLLLCKCNIPSMKQFFPWLSKISAMTQQNWARNAFYQCIQVSLSIKICIINPYF